VVLLQVHVVQLRLLGGESAVLADVHLDREGKTLNICFRQSWWTDIFFCALKKCF
jgi:hypothetical protein